MKISEFFSRYSRWCQRAFARTASNVPTDIGADNAAEHCLVGAIRAMAFRSFISREESFRLEKELAQYLRPKIDKTEAFFAQTPADVIMSFNDSHQTNWNDVSDALEAFEAQYYKA